MEPPTPKDLDEVHVASGWLAKSVDGTAADFNAFRGTGRARPVFKPTRGTSTRDRFYRLDEAVRAAIIWYCRDQRFLTLGRRRKLFQQITRAEILRAAKMPEGSELFLV